VQEGPGHEWIAPLRAGPPPPGEGEDTVTTECRSCDRPPGESTLPHRLLQSTEVYYIISGGDASMSANRQGPSARALQFSFLRERSSGWRIRGASPSSFSSLWIRRGERKTRSSVTPEPRKKGPRHLQRSPSLNPISRSSSLGQTISAISDSRSGRCCHPEA